MTVLLSPSLLEVAVAARHDVVDMIVRRVVVVGMDNANVEKAAAFLVATVFMVNVPMAKSTARMGRRKVKRMDRYLEVLLCG